MLQDSITTSQRAESGIYAALRNHIRTVEAQKMLEKVVSTHTEADFKRPSISTDFKDPMPSYSEQSLALLIQRSRV